MKNKRFLICVLMFLLGMFFVQHSIVYASQIDDVRGYEQNIYDFYINSKPWTYALTEESYGGEETYEEYLSGKFDDPLGKCTASDATFKYYENGSFIYQVGYLQDYIVIVFWGKEDNLVHDILAYKTK